jgi:hypothetical protein
MFSGFSQRLKDKVRNSGRVVGVLGNVSPGRIPPVYFGGMIAVPAFLIGEPGVHFSDNPGETEFIFNTFSLLVWGVLVMWMCAGFTML